MSNKPTAAQTCVFPEYAIGIREFGVVLAKDRVALPRCRKTALHGVAEGMWSYDRDGKKITHWERIMP